MNKTSWQLNALIGALILAGFSAELSAAIVDPESPLGWWLFALPDLVYFHIAPRPENAGLLDGIVYLLQSRIALGLARMAWRAWQEQDQRTEAAMFVRPGR